MISLQFNFLRFILVHQLHPLGLRDEVGHVTGGEDGHLHGGGGPLHPAGVVEAGGEEEGGARRQEGCRRCRRSRERREGEW